MDILFIIPGWPSNSFWDVLYFKFPPLAIATLAGLTPSHHTLSYVDESLEEVDFTSRPDLVAISIMTPLSPRGYVIADRFREMGVKVAIGGIHASTMPEEAAAHADAVVIGEADEIWSEIVHDAEQGKLKPTYRQSDFTRMERIPPANRSVYPPKGYFFENMIQTTRGCPYRCEFCTVTAFYGGTYRLRPIDIILKEVENLRSTPGYVFFVDDNFVARPDHTCTLVERLKDYRLRWVCQAPVTIAEDESVLKDFAKAGCHGIFIGFESLNDQNLNVMGKQQNKVGVYEKCIERIHEHGIGVYASFVFGYDYDTVAVFDQFLEFANRNALDGAFLPVLTPFPGTRVHKRLKAEGRILTENWSYYDMATVVYRPKGMKVEELQEGFWEVNKGFYSLSSTFKRLFRLKSIKRRSNIIFMPMNFGHVPAVRKAHRAFTMPPYLDLE